MKTADDLFEQGLAEQARSGGEWSNIDGTNHLDDALASFEAALTLDPRHRGALRARGLLLSAFGRHEEALDALIASAAQLPPDAEVLLATGLSLLEVGQAEQALASFEHRLQLLPGDDESILGKAKALMALDRNELALSVWNELTFRPKRPFRQWPDYLVRCSRELLRASTLARLGREEAFSVFHELIEREASHLEYVPELGAAVREHPVALRALTHYLHAHVTEAKAWRLGGTALLEAGHHTGAVEAWNRVIALEPSPDAHAARGQAHAALGDWAAAVEDCKRTRGAFGPGVERLRENLKNQGAWGPWKVMCRSAYAREDYVLAELPTKLAAQTRLAELEAAKPSTTPETYSLLAPKEPTP